MKTTDILIIGAGACGLMAARELAKAGKKVTILEARNRIGGRIFSLNEKEFGYPAQGGAEFVHGEAPITKSLIKEAGLTYIVEEGDMWTNRGGKLIKYQSLIKGNAAFRQKLSELKEDLPISEFLEKNFGGKSYQVFNNQILKTVEGYDAAEPDLISTLTLRDEWLNKDEWNDGKVLEGYGELINFLLRDCRKHKAEIHLSCQVVSVDFSQNLVSVKTIHGEEFHSEKIIVTVPLPVLKDINFTPAISDKIKAVDQIGFGNVMKVIIRFKDSWWKAVEREDLKDILFLVCNEKFLTWWTEYPNPKDILVGWMAGPEALKQKDLTDGQVLDLAIDSLAKVFKLEVDNLKKKIIKTQVVNWVTDPFTKGAYSYTTFRTGNAYEELAKPVDDTFFLAGEALCPGEATATVEGALASGVDVAKKILKA